MKIIFSPIPDMQADTLVIGIKDAKTLTVEAQELNRFTEGAVERSLNAAKFLGKWGETLTIMAPHGVPYHRLLIIGLGKEEDNEQQKIVDLGGKIYAALTASPLTSACIHLNEVDAALLAYGALLRSWSFEKYKTQKKNENASGFKSLTLTTHSLEAVKKDFATYEKIAEGVFIARHTASEPANVLTPESMVDIAKELKDLGVGVEILDEKHMRKLGMNALLGVGQGSKFDSHLIVLTWNGGTKGEAPVAIVGKGVTFDTGGICIKPAANMEDMKWDMGGAAVVLGLLKTLASRKANVNVVGVMGMVENMPSGNAQRPGDIVTSMSGQTIEVINTDAEGRLVLADALWYTQERYKPCVMIDLATLTGAIIIGLGHEMAGLFTNTPSLASALIHSGDITGEKVWHMPLSKIGEGYDKDIDTPAADVKNVGSNRGAGSITAAQFLQRFVNDVPWAHLDIAGVTWEGSKPSPVAAKGATGFGVRLLEHYIKTHHENVQLEPSY